MISKTNKAYFRAAEAVSKLSDYPRHKIGCVIVLKHHIVSSGCNSNSKCHPIQKRIDDNFFNMKCSGKVHAETAALIPLIKSGINLSDAVVYTYREHNNGKKAMARPCQRCMSLLKSCGIRRIKYTTDFGYAEEKID